MKKRNPTSIRMTEEAHNILVDLADHWGQSQSAIIEYLLRKEAKECSLEKKLGNGFE